tara:strand:+ start:769 stop:1008 length:240 start_codon:yes stop_codon:yes gene_type:complete
MEQQNTYEKPKTVIPAETWVELYATLSNYVLVEYSSLDPVWTQDENGGEVYTEENQEEFLEIANEVEYIMGQVGLIKGE